MNNGKLLVVDDNLENIGMVGTLLKDENYALAIAQNGMDAIEIALSEDPDLILLDIMMPEMDGYTVCRQLKADKKTNKIPIIFLSAKNETCDILKGFELGGVDYITKPFQKEILLARVKTHVDLKKKTELIHEQSEELRKSSQVLMRTLHQFGQLYSKE